MRISTTKEDTSLSVLTETPGRIETRKHTSTKEGRSNCKATISFSSYFSNKKLTFNPPAVVVKGNDAREAKAVESPANVPIEEDTGSIAGDDLEDEANDEAVKQGQRLLPGSDGAAAAVVEGTDSDSSSGGSGEDELLVNDVVLAQGNDEEDTEESSRDGQGNKLANVILGKERKKVEAVHSRNGTDEQDTDTTGS